MHGNPILRRQFLQRSASAAAAVAACVSTASLWTQPTPLLAQISSIPEPIPSIDDPRLKELIDRAIDAGRAAGAIYVDVRLTHSYLRGISNDRTISDHESMTVGVRALVDGYWGFASGPVWNLDEMVRLSQEAAQQAKSNALGKPRVTTLAPTPVVQGHWVTPIRIDPFGIHPVEVLDLLGGIDIYARRRPERVSTRYGTSFLKQDKAFGSSDGSYCTQCRYLTSGRFEIEVELPDIGKSSDEIDFLDPVGMGFELFDEQRLRIGVDQIMDDIKADSLLPIQPVDVGRYDILIDAKPLAGIISGTIGVATELDRILGYEANASGTSYLNDPAEMIGTLKFGSPALTVTMNRNEPGGAATIQWDDDGVVPEPVALVKDGILNDVQTTREAAGWLQALSSTRGRSAKSTGSSYAPSGMDAPLIHTGNLVLTPSTENRTRDDLLKDLKNGVYFSSLSTSLDFQLLSGISAGRAYQVSHGKKVARLQGAGLMFRASEFWKGLSAMAGASSARRSALTVVKGQPLQRSSHSVTAVPAVFTQQTITDFLRKI